jgi:hypothetical protein
MKKGRERRRKKEKERGGEDRKGSLSLIRH